MVNPLYFDYAAATPVDPEVLQAMQPYFSEKFYNPSATYLSAKAVAKDLHKARSTVAGLLGARPTEVIFTAGGTEANNLAIHGVMQKHPEANLVVSAIEHEAVLEVAKEYDHQVVPVTPQGVVVLEALEKAINDDTVLISIMAANNEIGTIQPLRQIGQIVAQIRKARAAKGNNLPLYLHTDASQATNYLDIHVSRLGVDLMTINGGKIYGPKQSGMLYVKAGLELSPWLRGGGQEQGLRSGTENIAQAVGLAKALELAQAKRHDETKRLKELQTYFVSELQKQIPKVEITAPKASKLPNNVHFTIPGTDNETLIMQLDEAGIMAAAGSACSASSDKPSHVLMAMGISEKDAQSSLRFTFGQGTTKKAAKQAVSTVASLVQ